MVVLKKGMGGVCVFVLVLLAGVSSAQSSIKSAISQSAITNSSTLTEVRELKVGDVVPDITFQNVLNYKSKTAQLSDFKSDLIILDFWSVWCNACIESFVKLDQIKKKYEDKVQVLLVNPYDDKHNSQEAIEQLFSKLKARTGFYPSLPIPIHDTILSQIFPHRGVPHQVWIDKDMRVVAITGAYELSEENIDQIIEGNEVHLPVKNDWAFNRKVPLLVDGNCGSSGDFLFRSLFTRYIGGIGFSNGIRANDKGEITGAYILNRSLWQLVNMAYPELFKGISKNRVYLEVKQPALFDDTYYSSNAYCYDLTVAPTKSNNFDLKKYLKEDLKRYFNVSVYKKTRKLKCYIVKSTDRLPTAQSTGQQPRIEMAAMSIKKGMYSVTLEKAIKSLQKYFDLPLIPEHKDTGKKIDVEFPENFDLSDTPALLSFLKKIGFEIVEGEREIEVVVITDN